MLLGYDFSAGTSIVPGTFSDISGKLFIMAKSRYDKT